MRAAPDPRTLTGWSGASPHVLRFFPAGFPPGFPVCPPGSFPSCAFLWFPFVRRSPVWSLRPLPGPGSPSVSLRGPFPLSDLHGSAAARRFRRRWSRAPGTKVTSNAAPTRSTTRSARTPDGQRPGTMGCRPEPPVTSGREPRTPPPPNRPHQAITRAGCQDKSTAGGNACLSEERGSRIGTAASRDAVIGLEQRRISRCWQPDATTSHWRPWPNPGFRMFQVVQREREETRMHLRYLWARHPAIAGGSVHHVQAVSSRVTLSPPSRCQAARSPVPTTRLTTAPGTQKALSLLGKGLDLRKLVAGGRI